MKDRILQNLHDFSSADPSKKTNPLFLELQEAFNYTTDELQKKAYWTLKELLHNYGFFEVLTIDKFNHKIIRTFARDLKIAQNFEVELDTDSLLNEAVLRVLNKAGSDRDLTKTLIDFSLEKIDDNKSWNIGFDLNQMAKILFKENHSLHLQGLQDKSIADFLALKKNLKKTMLELEEKSAAISKGVLSKIAELGFEFSDFPRETLPNHFKKIAAGETNLRTLYQNKLEENILEGKVIKSTVNMPLDQLLPYLTHSFLELKRLVHHIKSYKNAYRTILPLTLINEIQKEVRKLQEERNILSISDFNSIISKEVKDQPVPFIYERLGEKYRHYFIDEFQDTSKKQWTNLIPLIGNALESADENGETGSLLLVGDVKQAIYRWRGGEASQFLTLSTAKNNPFVVPPQVEQLGKNWRSHSTIVDFNNAFFTYLSSAFESSDFKQLFIEGNQQEKNESSGGYVQISFLERDKEAETHPHCQKTLQAVQSIIAHGYSYQDICILVRENKKGVVLANFLAQNDIPLISADALLLKNSPEVQFLVALLKHIEQPLEKTYCYEILSLLCPENQNFHDFLEGHLDSLDEFISHEYGFDLEQFALLPTYDLLEIAIRKFNLAANSNAYLNYFMDVVLEYGKKRSIAIFDFLEYWELKQNGLAISAPDHLDAVNIMTVHKSKGLEFPFVIFPFANSAIDGSTKTNDLWIPVDKEHFNGFGELLFNAGSELEYFSDTAATLYQEEKEKTILDSINVLYVALTRAIQGLYVFSDEEKGSRTTYASLLKTYLSQNVAVQANTSEYSFGQLTPQQRQKDLVTKETFIPYIYTTNLSGKNNPIKLAPSLYTEKNKEAIMQGNLVHSLMAAIHTKEDIIPAVSEMRNLGTLSAQESHYYENLALQIVTHKKLAGYFKQEIEAYNEKELLDMDGSLARPDRIVIANNTAILIDYKTGEPKEAHVNQLAHYGSILSKMGYFVTHKIVVYIDQTITPLFV